jgi:hypothetical protein
LQVDNCAVSLQKSFAALLLLHAAAAAAAAAAPMVGCRLVLPGPALDGASMYHMIEAYKVTRSIFDGFNSRTCLQQTPV